jgi:hypothetical protein
VISQERGRTHLEKRRAKRATKFVAAKGEQTEAPGKVVEHANDEGEDKNAPADKDEPVAKD